MAPLPEMFAHTFVEVTVAPQAYPVKDPSVQMRVPAVTVTAPRTGAVVLAPVAIAGVQ